MALCCQALLHADLTGTSSPLLPQATPVWLDPQDRIRPGPVKLSPGAETRSRANALYAEAMRDNPNAKPQETLSQLRQVADLDPHFADAQIKIATLLLESGQVDTALTQLKTAQAANPDSIDIETMLGYAQHLRGQNDVAIHLCQTVLAKDSTQTVAMSVLLEIAGGQNDLAGGVLHIEDILKAGGDKVPASSWLALAKLYVEAAQRESRPPGGAVILRTRLPILQQAASKSPPEVETFTLLADTYRDLGRPHDALKTLRQAAGLEPDNVDILLRCAEVETDLDLKAEALNDYESAYALNPGLSGLREMLGRLYLDHQRYEQAIPLLVEAQADAPDDAGVQIDLGIAYEGAHQPDQAEICFHRVFAAASCAPEAYLKLAVFQLSRQETKQAGATLADAQARFPKSARVRFYQAVEHRCEKNFDAAMDCLAQTRALATGPEAGALDADFYLESTQTLDLAGRKELIEPTLLEGRNKFPDNADLMNELAYFWADRGVHLPEALALSKRASEIEPDNGPVQDTRGWVYFQMGQAKDALPYLQRAAILTNNDGVVLQHIGDAYWKLGLAREAIAAWNRALEKDPHNGDLAKRMDAAMAQAKNAHLRSALH